MFFIIASSLNVLEIYLIMRIVSSASFELKICLQNLLSTLNLFAFSIPNASIEPE